MRESILLVATAFALGACATVKTESPQDLWDANPCASTIVLHQEPSQETETPAPEGFEEEHLETYTGELQTLPDGCV